MIIILDLPELLSVELKCAPVHITNYKVDRIVPNWMINLYIPDPASPIYRASILNGICSVESIKELDEHDIHKAKDTLNMFHLNCENVQNFTWNTGKVISISIDDRAKIVELFKGLNIFQIGRFGLWNRKLLIDSTMEQARMVIEHIIKSDWDKVKDLLVK